MKLPGTDVSIMGVRNVLGHPSMDLGTLCTSDRINPFSKWKPVNCNAERLTEGLLADAKYGITILSAPGAASLVGLIKGNGGLGFLYDRPKGGVSSPYRLGDFRNYDHDALPPAASFYGDGDTVAIGGDDETLDAPFVTSGDGCITAAMSGYGTGWTRMAYFTDGTDSCQFTGKTRYGSAEFRRFANKKVDVYEFLTDGAMYYALPYPHHTISVAEGGKVSVDCNWHNFGTYVEYLMSFSAEGGEYAGGTITGVVAALARDAKGKDIISSKGVAGSITVAGNGTSRPYAGTLPNPGKETDVYVLVYYDGKMQWKDN